MPREMYQARFPRLENQPAGLPSDVATLRVCEAALRAGQAPGEAIGAGGMRRGWWRDNTTALIAAGQQQSVIEELDAQVLARRALAEAPDPKRFKTPRPGLIRLDRLLLALADDPTDPRRAASPLLAVLVDNKGRDAEFAALPTARIVALKSDGAAVRTFGELADAFARGYQCRLLVISAGVGNWRKRLVERLYVDPAATSWDAEASFGNAGDVLPFAEQLRSFAQAHAGANNWQLAQFLCETATKLQAADASTTPARTAERAAKRRRWAARNAAALATANNLVAGLGAAEGTLEGTDIVPF